GHAPAAGIEALVDLAGVVVVAELLGGIDDAVATGGRGGAAEHVHVGLVAAIAGLARLSRAAVVAGKHGVLVQVTGLDRVVAGAAPGAAVDLADHRGAHREVEAGVAVDVLLAGAKAPAGRA